MLVVPPQLSDDQPAIAIALVGGGALALLLMSGLAHHLLFARATLQGRDKDGNVIPLRKIPMPASTLPILGNLVDMVKHGATVLDWVTARSIEFNNEPWMRKLPGQPEIITFTTPETIEEITTAQFENFEKGPFQLELITDMFGRGLVASDGERWYHQRKTAAKFFSARSLRAFMNKSMHKNMDQVCAVLETGKQQNKAVDLKKLFHEFTLQTFVEMGLGIQLNWIGAAEPHPFQAAIDTASPFISRRFRVPQWAWKLERWLNIGGEATFAKCMKTVYTWLHEVLQQSLEASNKKKKTQDEDTTTTDSEEIKSVVELFVAHSSEDSEGIRSDDLVDFLLTFVIAARDTTATTLAWLFLELSKNPRVEQAIRDEMQSRLPPAIANDRTAYLTTDHTRNLIFLDATIKEILRLRPAAPSTVKQVVRDTVICGDIPLYKGQLVLLSAWAMARSPRVWGPNAAEFRPERWINETTGELIQLPASKFFTFHAGPRTCIGMNLAMLELRVVVANLLHRFRFDVDAANDGSYVSAPTHVMKYSLLAKVRAA